MKRDQTLCQSKVKLEPNSIGQSSGKATSDGQFCWHYHTKYHIACESSNETNSSDLTQI